MNASDLMGMTLNEPIKQEIKTFNPKRLEKTVAEKFDDILEKCPRTKKVRNFVKDWLEEIAAEKMQTDYDNLF